MNIFLERYKQLGESFDPAEIVIPQAIRINTLKITEEEILERLKPEGVTLKKIPFLDFGYRTEHSPFSLGGAPEHLMGYYYIQETAAQIPVQMLKPSKKDVVLDMSAAPGGKTTQIAQYMENQGVIIAVDNNNLRLLTLKNNLERLGIANAIIYQKDSQFVSDLGITFDKVLLDAPCSGNFAVDKDWLEKRKMSEIKEITKTQKQLLHAAAEVLKDGGELIYSTCSLEPEEDEFVVDWYIKDHPEMKLQKLDLAIGDPGLTEAFGEKLSPSLKHTRRFWPHKTKTQGFFIAKFRKEV